MPWYAVKRWLSPDAPTWSESKARPCAWVEDPATDSPEFGRSEWFDSSGEARAMIVAAGRDLAEHQLVRCAVDPAGGNHFLMDEVPW